MKLLDIISESGTPTSVTAGPGETVYSIGRKYDVIQTDLAEDQTEQFCPNCGGSLAEEGRASRALCTSGRPDSALGASQLASCKSQGLRSRDGEKSHLITHGARKVRVTVGGKTIKGKKYGGPLPDYGTRKKQLNEADALLIPTSKNDTDRILQLQQVLINFGYRDVKLTSVWDKDSMSALKDFQLKHDIVPNGLPQADTIWELNNYVRSHPNLLKSSTPNSKPSGTPSTTPSTTPNSKPSGTPSTTPSTTPGNTSPGSVTGKPPSNKPHTVYPSETDLAWLPKGIHDKSPWNMNNDEGKRDIVSYLAPHMGVNHLKGIMANMSSESLFEPGMYVAHDIAVPENIRKMNPNTSEYKAAYRAWRTSDAYLSAGPSGGLCQWHNDRFIAMVTHCGGMSKWQQNWKGQLDFLLAENLTKAYLKRPQASAEAATSDWMVNWERPHDVTDIAQKGRSDELDKIFHKPPKKT